MKMRGIVAAIGLVALIAPSASGQSQAADTGRVAFDIGTTAPLALLWKVNDDFALRPDLTFVHLSGVGNVDTWRFGVGASALASVHRTGALTTYVGVRGGYAWYSASDSPTEWSVVGIFGGRYALASHFGISAETGVEYDKSHLSGALPESQSIVAPWARLGALFFF